MSMNVIVDRANPDPTDPTTKAATATAKPSFDHGLLGFHGCLFSLSNNEFHEFYELPAARYAGAERVQKRSATPAKPSQNSFNS